MIMQNSYITIQEYEALH